MKLLLTGVQIGLQIKFAPKAIIWLYSKITWEKALGTMFTLIVGQKYRLECPKFATKDFFSFNWVKTAELQLAYMIANSF